MINYLKPVWNDPVFSKVIATGIISLAGLVGTIIYEISSSLLFSVFVGVLCLTVVVLIFNYLKKSSVEAYKIVREFGSLAADYELAYSNASDKHNPAVNPHSEFHKNRKKMSDDISETDRLYFAKYKKIQPEIIWAWNYFTKEKYQFPKIAYDMIKISNLLSEHAAKSLKQLPK